MASETVQARTCRRCKAESATGAGYVNFSGQTYCPACYPKEREESARWSLLRTVLVMGFGALLIVAKVPGPGWLIVNFYITVLIYSLLTLPHELGHALAAHGLGMRVHRVNVGVGPILWKVPFLKGTLEIHRYFFGGYTLALDRRVEGARLRQWIGVACGPLVNLLLFLVMIPFLPHPFSAKTLGQGCDFRLAFLGANALVLGLNLLPLKRPGNLGMGSSDGYKLLTLPFLKPQDIRSFASGYYLIPASDLLSAGRNEEALEMYREGMKEFPESTLLRHDMAVALIRLDKIEEARDIYLAISTEKSLEPRLLPYCLSNLAACNIQLGRADLVGEADRCSAEAMTSMAWHAGIKGTRSSVLFELGRFEEGLRLAKEALDSHSEDRGKAEIATTLALAFHAKGDLVEGRKYFDLATKLECRSRRYSRARELFAAGIPS